jgi:hypothetical protein
MELASVPDSESVSARVWQRVPRAFHDMARLNASVAW